uniref:splicing factor, suppressor of white-apricot homolog isoform X2 n=1 Tax=Fragaria vesca subsp. vesca TaxID=101020 RepID=UPI0005C91B97|nr:PREDICTED: splicing factor, suppressor of white-apricot homolog isoform X2 [Fragaria vesca subsp. vesca]
MQPPTEKIHQIIARTAMFVAKHGGQSEIVLRVKQGDNAMFGFLMPDHHLHAYFRFLVDHQELLKQDTLGVSVQEEKNNGGLDQTGGALSLLGSVYGSGEDEDDTAEDASVLQKLDSPEDVDAISATVHGSEQKEYTVTGKNDIVSKFPCSPLKEKVDLIKHNRITSTVKGGATSGMKKESVASGSLSTAASKSQAPAMPSALNLELPVLEPPSDQRRVVEKIVEFILKNGREFEAILAEQNCKQGRFLFLLPSNQYHPYYLKVLQDAQESKLHGKHLISEKQESAGRVVDKKAAKSSDAISSGSAGHEIPFDYDRKEKFKMVIGKSKKDGHDLPSKSNQPEVGFSVDAVAAILQAATRGIKKPGLDIFPKPSSSGVGQGSSNDGGRDLSSGSQKGYFSSGVGQVSNVPVPVAKAIAETAALAAASEADSSEASLTKEQKLKAERLKRAKMFAAMIKGGCAPLKTDSLRGLSAEPPESGVSSSGNEVLNLATIEREGSSAPLEGDVSDKVEEYGKKLSIHECNERRSKKAYHTPSKRIEEDGEGDDDEENENKGEDKKGRKHSKKRRSHHSSDNGKDKHRHKRHSSSKDRDSRRHRRHESPDEKHRHSRSKHKNNSSDDEHQPSKRHRHHSSSDDDHWRSERQHTHSEHRTSRSRHKRSDSSDDERRHSRRRHNRGSSFEDEHRHRRTSVKQREPETEKDMELEEGEILLKLDQSIASGGGNASREASVDISKSDEIGGAPSQPSGATVVSDDLRAKIRAMLMATL